MEIGLTDDLGTVYRAVDPSGDLDIGFESARSTAVWGQTTFTPARAGAGHAARGGGRAGTADPRLRPLSLAGAQSVIAPINFEWTLHARVKAGREAVVPTDVERAITEHHSERRRNPGDADWLLTGGRLVVAYNWPFAGNPLEALIVTLWRRPR